MRGAACAALAVLSLAGSAGAARVYVANDGVDGDGCGARSAPCRSITRGIARANAGDTIVVGPGRYGELTGDGLFESPGEEAGAAEGMIRVDKRVRIESSAGATATVIHGAGLVECAVAIAADSVVFGASHKGFTVTGAGAGVLVTSGVTGVTLRGNLAVSNDTGFRVLGAGHSLIGNVAVANEVGFLCDTASSTLRDNQALANQQDGFTVSGNGNLLERNTASANGLTGISFQGDPGELRGNAVVANGAFGASLGGGALEVRDLSALGNQHGLVPSVATVELRGGSLYGNRECALFNTSLGAIAAERVYWGSPLGPSDSEPADPLCGATTTATPLSRSAPKLKVKPLF